MIRLFLGYDQREAVGFHVFCSSVIRRASEPVSITAVQDEQEDGSNAFTYARYSVPELCGFDGWAIFADASDMLCLGDIAELWNLKDDRYAVQVVRHSYKTRHPIKYVGTNMQCPNVDYPRKNWSSLMLINCSAPEWKNQQTGRKQHQFSGFDDSRIGFLPLEWNVLVDEGEDDAGAKILHYTAGIPGFWYYRDTMRADDWHSEHEFMRQAHV